MADDLEDIADRADLREGAEGVRRLFAAFVRSPGIGVRPVARDVGLPIPVAVAVVGEMEKAGLVVRSDEGVELTGKGGRLADELGIEDRPAPPRYPDAVPDAYRDAVATVERVAADRPEADVTRDQAFATPATAVRRALVLLAFGALEGRRVLFVGDGDLASVACAALGDAAELCVVDVDDRLEPLYPDAVRFVDQDLRDGFPDDLRDRFDAAVTDPPFTAAGAELFLSRAVEGLRSAPGLSVLFSFGHVDPDRLAEVQGVVRELGYAIRALIPRFNVYEGAHALGGRGDLVHLETTSRTRPTVGGAFDEAIYTREGDVPIRRYVCTGCGTAVRVGEDPATIEELKDAGCPSCGGSSFRYEGRDAT